MALYAPIANDEGPDTVLAAPLAIDGDEITVVAETLMPDAGDVSIMRLGDEILKITGAASGPYEIERAVDGTEAAAHAAGAGLAHVDTPKAVRILADEQIAELGDVIFEGDSRLTDARTPTAHTHVKGEVGLGNVDNTSDADKPVSTAQQTALNAKANDADVVKLAGPQTLTGAKQGPNGSASVATWAARAANNGIWSPAASTIALGGGGVESLRASNSLIRTLIQFRFDGPYLNQVGSLVLDDYYPDGYQPTMSDPPAMDVYVQNWDDADPEGAAKIILPTGTGRRLVFFNRADSIFPMHLISPDESRAWEIAPDQVIELIARNFTADYRAIGGQFTEL